jgi:tetratricopeptide (TPR) repeat protein
VVNNTIINLPSQAQGFGVVAPGQQPARPAGVRPSNAAARDLAKRQIAAGDTLFGKQQYAQALESYKQAARAAPDLADSHFRQMVALVALGRYETAVDAVKNGMRISKDTINGQFRVSAMYGDNLMARAAHLEALAKLTAERRTSDLYFLAGVMLFFDDPPQRSAPFFEQASQIAVVERWHIDVFREVLKRLPEAAAQANGDGPAAAAVPGEGAARAGEAAGAAAGANAPAAPAKRVMRPAPDDPAGAREI